ncbi:c-type cytochrome [Mesobacterium sp. TK19101]|uniref:C-type cytochrome n=1 Tax=Mesobacterium hydrothermale TaxID=3111907 RepID=A0ABU6HLS1_9RHOB|nr:c-type cytochrome [Mesobacterium sp. TK19101]MEC3863398.1 c-type cytochrome [Mesobacterium sp. TK19101]
MKQTVITGFALTAIFGLSAFAQEGPPDPEKMLASPSSNVAWTEETLQLLATADPARGESVHGEQLCASCHGDYGIGQSENWPSLAGQVRGYIYKSLVDYHDWERSVAEGGELMGFVVEELTEQDFADLAAFFAAQSRPAAQNVELTEEQFAIADGLHWLGDPDRMIQPCSACHGETGKGVFPNYPSLTGQYVDYTRLQLQLYRDGARHSDVYARMRTLSAELTDEEIEALSLYYAQMGEAPVAQTAGNN